jgi:hypothetical protein
MAFVNINSTFIAAVTRRAHTGKFPWVAGVAESAVLARSRVTGVDHSLTKSTEGTRQAIASESRGIVDTKSAVLTRGRSAFINTIA